LAFSETQREALSAIKKQILEHQCILKDLQAQKLECEGVTQDELNDLVCKCQDEIKALEAQKANHKSDLKTQRSMFVKNDCDAVLEHPWLKERCPFDVRDEALRDLLKNYTSNFARNAKGTNASAFKLHFKRKKDPEQSIALLKKHWKDGMLFPTIMRQAAIACNLSAAPKIRGREVIPMTLDMDGRILRTRDNAYFLTINRAVKVQTVPAESQGCTRTAVVSIDPGVRTFLSCYDPQGAVVEFGSGDMGRIARLHAWISMLQRQAHDSNHKKRYTLSKAIRRIFHKIKNLVKDLHFRAVNWLVNNYRVILLPCFDPKRLVAKKTGGQFRALSRTSVRQLLSWSHCQFRDRLVCKAQLFHDSRVVLCTEEYTSKTCGQCGRIHACLGSNKQFDCPSSSCAYSADRDHNAARNILLKYLTELPTGRVS
jgi:transposase